MPLPQLNSDGQHQEARRLIWLHGQPLGEVHHGVLVRWR
jgi:hypothetical protein